MNSLGIQGVRDLGTHGVRLTDSKSKSLALKALKLSYELERYETQSFSGFGTREPELLAYGPKKGSAAQESRRKSQESRSPWVQQRGVQDSGVDTFID